MVDAEPTVAGEPTGPDDGEVLTGGNMGLLVRVGDSVRRPAGYWTPTVHRLLHHLHARGVDWVPRPLGVTEGREVVSYLPGRVPQYPLPDWAWAESVLVEAGRRLAEFHDATEDFDRTDAEWQVAGHAPAEVVCHNDVAPYNMVFDEEHRMVGLIDCDVASPGPRVWDLAYLAYRLVPMTGPANPDVPDLAIAERRRRLSLLCQAYGHGQDPARVVDAAVERLVDLAEFTLARAEAGAGHLHEHVRMYRQDAAWLRRRGDRLLNGEEAG